MSGIVRPTVFGIAVVMTLALTLAPVPAAAAPQTSPTGPPVAPLAQPGDGRAPKVFISNLGSDDDMYSDIAMSSSDGWSQAFNKFYAAVQSSGQYEVVGSPAEAAHIFEMWYADLIEKTTELRDDNNPPQSVAVTIHHPQLHLTILDARTLAVQGTFTELIAIGRHQKDRDRIFAAAIQALVNDAGRRLGRPMSGAFTSGVASDAPVPRHITAATTVFISNASGPGIFGGTPSTDEAYNEFYAMMQSAGGYQLSPTTTGADLIFQISDNSWFRLAIIAPHTGVTLWAFPAEATTAILKINSQKNFDRMLTGLLLKIRKVGGRPPVAISVHPDAKAAPIPPQIAASRTVFIANGGEETLGDGKGEIERAYDDFYATIQAWGRYELVPSPSQADLVFQISLNGSNLDLAILDSQTHTVLWKLAQKIQDVSEHTVRHDDFSKAMAALVKRTADLAGRPAAGISVPANTTAAPIPPGISASAKIFLSKPRSSSAFPEKHAPDQIYNQCYEALKTWGKYELTTTPAEADLIFEPSASASRVRLTIRDAKTRQVEWTLTQPVKYAFLSRNATKNYIDAIGLLMDDMRGVAARSAQPAENRRPLHDQ